MSTARLDVDRPAIGRTVSLALGVLASIAFAAGYPSLAEVARWSGMADWSAWTIPAVVDLGMVVLGLSAMVQRARHESAVLLWSATAALVSISIAAQVAHAMTSATVTGWVLAVAVAVACTPPATTLVAAEAALRLVVATPVPRRPRRPAPSTVPTPLPPATAQAAPVTSSQAGPQDRSGTFEEPATAEPDRPARTAADRDSVIREARELIAAGQSTRQAAEALGVSRSSLTRWLSDSSSSDRQAA